MIPLPLEQRVFPALQNYQNDVPSLSALKEYFEKAYIVSSLEKSVWTKNAEGKPLPHGGISIDGLAKSLGTSRKNASYLVHQKYNLTSFIDFYRCEQETKPGNQRAESSWYKKSEKISLEREEFMAYEVIDKLLEDLYATYHRYVVQDMAKYSDILPEQRKEEVAHEIAIRYVQETVKELPKRAKVDFFVNRILEQNLPLADAKKEFEKHIIAQEWNESQFSLDETAKRLMVSPRHLRRKIQAHKLIPEQVFYFPLAFLSKNSSDNSVTH